MGKWYDRYIMMSLYSFAVIRTVASKLVWIYWLVLFIHDHRKMVKIGWAKNTIKICRLVFRDMASAANDPKNVVIESAFVTFFLFSSVHEVIKNPVSFQYYLAQVHFCESFANSGSSVETVLRSSGQRARPLLCRSELETLQSQHFNSNSFTWFLWKSESMKLSERFQNVNFGTPQKPCGQSYKTFYVSKLWL